MRVRAVSLVDAALKSAREDGAPDYGAALADVYTALGT
jgi:hypothetical protein